MEYWYIVSLVFALSSAYAYYNISKMSNNLKNYRDELDAATILLEMEKSKNRKLALENKRLVEDNKSLKEYKNKVKKVADFFDGTKP